MEDESNKKSEETVASNDKTEKKIEIIIQKKKNEIKFFEIFRETKRIFSNERQKKKLSAETEVAFATQIKIMLPLALATALENIIIESNVGRVHDLKYEGKDISKVTWENGENALHVAAKWAKTTEMIDVIQENGKFDINGVDSNGYTPLIYALLGTNPTIDHEGGEYNKDIDLFDLFLKPEKVDNDSGKSGRPTRLMNESNFTTTSYLIEKGADPNIATKGWTPFLLAARYSKDINILRLFLVNNTVDIDVNCKNNNDGWNALLLVCRYYDQDNLIKIVQLLIDNKIDVNCKTNDGWNALNFVCRHYDQENLIKIVQLLIDKNIDVHCKENDGWNALLTVCRYYDKENLIDIVRLLIEKNIDVNCKTENDGWNALNFVCRHYDKENLIDIVRLLIEKNIDVNSKNKYGDNALTFLCQCYNKENLIDIVRLLINKNIDVNCKNNNGWNALHAVCYCQPKSRLVDLVRLLVQHKIDKKVKTTAGGTARSFLLNRFKEKEIRDILLILDSELDVIPQSVLPLIRKFESLKLQQFCVKQS